MAGKGVRDRQPFRLGKGVAIVATKAESVDAGGLRGEHQKIGAIGHQLVIGLAGAIPFQHGEFGMVQRPALAIAPDMREGAEPLFSGGQQLLGGKFRRGVEIEGERPSVDGERLRCEGMQMRLVAGRDLKRRRLHLNEIALGKPEPECGHQPVATHKKGPPVGMDMRLPPGAGAGHGSVHLSLRANSSRPDWRFHRNCVSAARNGI